MDHNFLWDESPWYYFLLELKKRSVLNEPSCRKLPFFKCSIKDIEIRSNQSAFNIVYRRIPFLDVNSLSIIKQNFFSRKTFFIPAIPNNWLNLLKSNNNKVPLSWNLSPYIFRIFIFINHILEAQLLRYILVNIFSRSKTRPNSDSVILLDFPRSLQAVNDKYNNKTYSLLQSLISSNIISKEEKIFSRFNTKNQIKYRFPFHSIPLKRFIPFLIKSIFYECYFLFSLLCKEENVVLLLIDDIIEILYLSLDPRAPYKSLYATQSSLIKSNKLSNLPSSSNEYPLAYLNLVFYSQNDRKLAISLKENIDIGYIPFPYYRVITMTDAHGEYLKSISCYQEQFTYKAIGKIDLRDEYKNLEFYSNLNKKILIFPVDYKEIDWMTAHGYPLTSIYSKFHYLEFMEDINLIKNEFNLSIIIKNKSMNENQNLDFYFLSSGISARRAIEEINPDLIICMPWTAPSLYAPERSIFYYPLTQIQFEESVEKEIPFIIGKEELRKYIKKNLL